MMMKVFSVFDKAVGAYTRPFCTPSAGAAMRAFEDDVANAESPVAKHPEDYSLFWLGSFDDNSGLLTPEEPPVCLINAHEVVAKLREVDRFKLADIDREISNAS